MRKGIGKACKVVEDAAVDNCPVDTGELQQSIKSETPGPVSYTHLYLVLTGMDADEETIAAMKENRALVIPEGGGAEYLTKSVSDTQIQNLSLIHI